MRGRGGVLWSFADALVLSSNYVLEKGPPPLLGSTVGNAFISVKKSVFGWILMGEERESNQLGSPGKRLFPRRGGNGEEVQACQGR